MQFAPHEGVDMLVVQVEGVLVVNCMGVVIVAHIVLVLAPNQGDLVGLPQERYVQSEH